jgi:thioredoxin-like negative regulator of GroEL
MISSLWPGAGGAAQQRAARASAEARAASAVRPLASRLELEAELRACEAPGAPPLLVILSTSWCGPCKLLAEDLQEAAERRAAQRGGGGAGAVRIVKLDVEQREGGLAEVASALKVQKLPTLFVCGGRGAGKPALRTTGLLKRKVIDDLIDRSAFMGSDLGSAVLY